MSQATGYFTHQDCWRHEMGHGHPECPERLDAIQDRLLISGLDVALERREATAASMADLELAHGRMHLASLRGLSDQLAEEILAPTPGVMLRRRVFGHFGLMLRGGILLIIILSWIYFGRGRHIGKRAPPTTGLLIPRHEAAA